jgi:hypothetical protein
MADPGRFSLPCSIGHLPLIYALADVGASVNLMPNAINKNLNLGKPHPIRSTIELADGRIKQPEGIWENVLIKIRKFVFPANFLILEIGNEYYVPLIL